MDNKHKLWSDLCAFLGAAKDHWRKIVGGGAMFILIGIAATVGLKVPWWLSLIAVFCLAVVVACFLAWRDEHETVANLAERIEPKMLISGGESIDKSCIVSNGDFFFRARLESIGVDQIYYVEAHVTSIKKNGNPVEIEEIVQLMMHPAVPALPMLRKGVPGFADVIRTEFSKPVLATARGYSIDTSLSFGDRHEIDVTFTGVGVPPQTRTFLFIWSANHPVGYKFEMLNDHSKSTSSSRLQT